MKPEQIAVQLYTLRESITTPDDLENTLRRVREIGYPAVELAGLPAGMVPPGEVKALLESCDLALCATHCDGPTLLENPEAVVADLQALGCTHTAYPYPAGIDLGSPDAVDTFIDALDRAGSVLAGAGITLCYHNHHMEFRRTGDTTILERLLERTDPGHLAIELDTHWVQRGGADPVAWCRRLDGRLPILHMKDYKINADNEIAFAEIGDGNLDFAAIVEAAEASGCKWFVVEQDTCDRDPFEAIARSLDYVRTHLLA